MFTEPLRQKMLFKTEWRSISASGASGLEISDCMNKAFRTLAEEGFNVVNMLPAPCGDGFLIIGQRVGSPVPDPTPHGVPFPGTTAVQNLEITYAFVTRGTVQRESMPTLKDAINRAWSDMSREGVQPISINVASITTYGPGDFSVLHEKFR